MGQIIMPDMNVLRRSPMLNEGKPVGRKLSDPDVATVAGLDWAVEKIGLYTEAADVVASHRAIKRSDTGDILGIVGHGYVPVQNSEVFGWLRSVAGMSEAIVERAGCRDNGSTVWALARFPTMDIRLGKDYSAGHMLFTTSHDGGGAVRAQPMMIREVCTNGLRMMFGARGNRGELSTGYSFRHTSGVHDSLRSVADAYARTLTDYRATREAYAALAGRLSTRETLATIVAATWPVKVDADEAMRAATIRENREAAIARIRRSATCAVEGTAGTVFADLQAVTEYIDHDAGKDASARFGSAYFGAGDDAKGRAWSAALALV